MKYLPLISVILLLGSCSKKTQQMSASPDAPCFRSAVPVFTSALYDAGIDVAGYYISGLLFVKTMPDSSSRMVFSNETGITFFDFEWSKVGEFKTHFVMPRLKKKAVINSLRKDLELLMVPESIKKSVSKEENDTVLKYIASRDKEILSFVIGKDCQSIIRVDVMGKDKRMVDAVFFPTDKNVPDSVSISHYNFKMKIALKRIEHQNVTQ